MPVTFQHMHGEREESSFQEWPGMTLRDYFAAKALPLANADEIKSPTFGGPSYEGVAVRAYNFADAMLKERAK